MSALRESADSARQSRLLLVAVVGLLVWIGFMAFVPEPAGIHGQAHPSIAGMRQGGDAETRHAPLLLWGWLLGCGMILTFSALIHFGALGRPGRAPLKRWLGLGTLLYLGAWTTLVLAYRASLGAETPELFLALPAPTAVMLYLFWPVSMVFNWLFVLGFRRWVLTDEEEAAFTALVEEKRRSD